IFVVFFAGNQVAAQVGFGRIAALGEIIRHHAEFLEHVAADIHALMTGDAAILLELRVTGLLFGGDGVGLAAKISVETGVGRDQRALEAGYGILDIRLGDAIGIGGGERFAISA